MRRALGFTIVALLLLVCASTASAATYYIAANGSDSNSATQAQSKTTPWLHAPGMANCSNACASYNPQPGDRFIFRGGDTWHFEASATVAVGGSWQWQWSGSSGNPIYLGVDQTWYTGSSWVRPILNYDNPTTTSGYVSSCAYDYYNLDGFHVFGANYVTIDNFEMSGMCAGHALTGYPTATMLDLQGNNETVSNSYFHGWSEANNSTPNIVVTVLQGRASGTGDVVEGNVIDGSDTYCTGVLACEGWASGGMGYDIHQNVVRYIANGFNGPNDMQVAHDNEFDHIYQSADQTQQHCGMLEEGAGAANAPSPLSVYNNVVSNVQCGIIFNLYNCGTLYFFNNVMWTAGNSGNALELQNCNPSSTATVDFTNNTWEGPGYWQSFTPGPPVVNCTSQSPGCNATINFENNYFIAYRTPSNVNNVVTGTGTYTVVDNGGEVWQTEAVANAQNYVPASNYAPTSGSGATVSVGANLASSCNAYSSDGALCSGTSGAVAEISGSGGKMTQYPAIPMVSRPSLAAWDSGAFESGASSSSSAPNPPTGLTAVAQ